MILSDKKLRLQDDITFVEADPPKDRSRPLEWRRRLNVLRFEASKFSIDFAHWVNESEFFVKMTEGVDTMSQSVPIVKSAINSRISIATKIPFNEIRDDFYKVNEEEKDSGNFLVSRDTKAHNLVFTIADGEPLLEDWGIFKAGSFAGNAGFYDDDGTLFVEVKASKAVLLELVNSISSGNLEKIIFNIEVSCFSYEVDDFLREWDDSRDLLVHGITTPAALISLVVRKSNKDFSEFTQVRDNASDQDIEEKEDEMTPLNRGFLVKDVVVDTSEIKSIKFAIWALVFVLSLMLLK